jgi:SpoVK/Ycf46/Vps4 family AAA+-type ATPase
LTWLSDHESDVFFIGTTNDITRLPPEFSRAERFDQVAFIDLPDRAQRNCIWQIHRAGYHIPECQELPDDSDWTGAEIRACCRLAALLDVTLAEAAAYVVPVAATASESVGRLRTWAAGRCLDAARGGIYRAGKGPARRRVRRDPTRN